MLPILGIVYLITGEQFHSTAITNLPSIGILFEALISETCFLFR